MKNKNGTIVPIKRVRSPNNYKISRIFILD